MFKVPCPRCMNEKGVISAFRHVRGGVCFKCGGAGYVERKTEPRPMKSWRVGAVNLRKDHPHDHEAGAVIFPILTVKAATETAALKKAKAMLARGSAYDPESAFVRERTPGEG